MDHIIEADQFPARVDIQRKGDDILLPKSLVNTVTLPDGSIEKFIRDGAVGRFTRKADGTKVLKMRWHQRWWPVPTLEQVEEWTFDSVCETPDGRTVEHDADDSWMRLLGLI